jgi:hypothetical protein
MPFKASGRGAYGPQGQKVIKGPLAPVWVSSGTLATAGMSAYSVQLSATDDSGDAPTYTLASGSLPPGITLSSSGLLSGNATGASTTYTFTVNATDVNGRATTSSTFSLPVQLEAPPGGDLYQSPGTYTWTAPAGVTKVHVVAVGGGGSGAVGNTGNAGAGGGLGWKNNITVVPGTGYTVVVGSGGTGRPYGCEEGQSGQTSYFINTSTVYGGGGQGGGQSNESGCGSCRQAGGGGYGGDGGGNGGNGGYECNNVSGPGGGGAGGYTNRGGYGSSSNNGSGEQGYGGGGGAGGNGGGGSCYDGGGGGGVGVYGEGASGGGAGNPGTGGYGGGGGSGGGGGGQAGGSCYSFAGAGGAYGGGGGGTNDGQSSPSNPRSGAGGRGAVRIIWGGSRTFPSQNVGLNYGVGTIAGATNEVTRA